MEEYTPKDPELAKLWSRLKPAARRRRLQKANKVLALLNRLKHLDEGESFAHGVRRLLPGENITNVRRWRKAYSQKGFDGLMDRRIAPPSSMPPEARQAIITLRRADPDFDIAEIVEHLKEFHQCTVSEGTVSQVLRDEGLNRPCGPRQGSQRPQIQLELGGMKLIEAACIETGYLESLTTSIVEHVKDLPRPATPSLPDRSGKDEYGRFRSEYNERYRKGPDDAIGPGFASVAEKRKTKDPDRLQISHARPEVIERKLMALLVSPLLGGGRWDGMRISRGDLLSEVCTISYMPATLDRFTRELKYAGVANTMWETHACQWLKLTPEWGEAKYATVAYIDGTTKPVWTRYFSQSTKVSNVGRIMPGIEVVAFHSGYGVPLWMMSSSGRAPLVEVVPKALANMEVVWGESSVARIVVIDAEANSVPFLKGLEKGTPQRAWVTRLRDGMVQDKHIFNRTNYRAYRDGDRVRMGEVDLNDPDGVTFRARVVEVERRTSGKITYLGASTALDPKEWKPQDLADLYFERWPNQEANFRAVNQAAGFKEVHGYGKQLVTNVTVVTKLDKLEERIRRAEQRESKQRLECVAKEDRVREGNKQHRRMVRRLQTVDRHVQERVQPGMKMLKSTHKLLQEQRELTDEVASSSKRIERLEERLEQAKTNHKRTEGKLTQYREQQAELESRREIFAHDVELDSIFSLMKVGLIMLVTYVLREYLGKARMEVSTFLDRIATLPASLNKTPTLEIVTFQYNRRDPDVMDLLRSYSESINARQLKMRSGRTLRIQIEEPPAPTRPPPKKERTISDE